MTNRALRPARSAARRRIVRLTSGLAALGLLAACDMGLNLKNPNSPTEQTALTNVDGIVATSLGMQEQFAASVLTFVRAPALVTDEWGTASKALAADISLFTGLGIDPSYGVVSEPYYNTYRVARTADAIIGAAPGIPGLSPGFAAGLTANAKLFKAMALGMSAMQYERLPIDVAPGGGTPVPRAQVFAEVIRLLESARADVGALPDTALAGFNSRALSPGFDLKNTINAMLARYYLYTDQYQQAIDAAQRVDRSKVSLLAYPGTAINPIYNYSVVAGYVAPLKAFADSAEAGDRRVGFWVNTTATPPVGNPPSLQLLQFRMYSNRNDPFPVYIPGEMLLIQAEAQARLGHLDTAVGLINQERAETGTATTPGAQLPALNPANFTTLDQVLAQIAYERRYELFSQGLRWEDLRRLGQYIGRQPKLDFLPMPSGECQANPNAGC